MKYLIAFILFIPFAVFADDVTYGIDLYGRSYHQNLKQGARDKLNESNIGYGLHINKVTGKHRFTTNIGTFQNSYYDQAFWIGGQYTYRLLKHLEIGAIARHWETANDSYPEKAINVYKLIAIPINDKARVAFYFGSFGYVGFVSIGF